MRKKLKVFMLMGAFIATSFSVFALADKDGCTPGWAPFWSTSCRYIGEDQNGEAVVYETTCRHFIFTTKCTTAAVTDL